MMQEGGEVADFQVVDKTMEKFGWPMAPAYLLTWLVSTTTASMPISECMKVFPDRNEHEGKNAVDRVWSSLSVLARKMARFFIVT